MNPPAEFFCEDCGAAPGEPCHQIPFDSFHAGRTSPEPSPRLRDALLKNRNYQLGYQSGSTTLSLEEIELAIGTVTEDYKKGFEDGRIARDEHRAWAREEYICRALSRWGS